jgi:hypothetical protein
LDREFLRLRQDGGGIALWGVEENYGISEELGLDFGTQLLTFETSIDKK